MRFCVQCGARVTDAGGPVCPDCGAPRPAAGPAGTAGRTGYVRFGATRLPVWLPWALAAVLVAGGVSVAVAVAHRPDPAAGAPAGLVSPWSTDDGQDAVPSPYDDGSTAPETPETYPGDDSATEDGGGYDTGTPTPEPSDTQDASTVVTTYYDYLNAGDYPAAWALGGSRLYQGSYTKWVAGFAGTAHVEVTASDTGGGEVRADLRATQDDGSVRVFTGTYTVTDGRITGARIREVS
ncbi:hypothetical protein [Streptomyces sp. NPDC051132]|uniref:hypothetical protein n=1 Tax=unclassified Streptomyces TaxID=2593676 RepID=UPI0034425302